MFKVYLVVFGGFACLFPLAFYCLLLASWNGRRRPMIVSGPADFAGVLVATSGFLITGGPLILSGMHDVWRRATLHGSFAEIRTGLDSAIWPWAVAWIGYFVLVVGGALWLLIRRRSVSVIYNIDPTDAKNLIPETVRRLKLTGAWRGPAFWIEMPEKVGIRRVIVNVTIVPSLRHMLLRWPADSGTARQHVETALRRVISELNAPENPAAGWFLTAATGQFALLLMLLALFLFRLWHLRG